MSFADGLGLSPDYLASARSCRRPLWLAFRRDYPLRVTQDPNALSSLATAISARFNRDAADARYSFDRDRVVVVPDVTGWHLDVAAFLATFSFEGGFPRIPERMDLPGILLPPAVFARELEPHLPFERISTFKTHYADGNARAHNIGLCCAPLSVVAVGPGQTFSFNRSVGPRTAELGYLKAPVIVGDQTVDDFGGGVCQVSTTVYIAMLKAGFQISERYCHAKPVDYVPLGFDATVAYDYLDLRMVNPGQSPCVVRVFAKKGEITAEVFGRPLAGLSIQVESRILKEIPAEEAPGGSPAPAPPSDAPAPPALRSGFLVETVRKWVKGGRLERLEHLNTSMYPPEKAK